jgi:hypothetical protein
MKKVTYVVYQYNENASPNYRGSRFITTYESENIEILNNVIIIAKDISETEAYRLCNERNNQNIDSFINSLPDELRTKKGTEFLRNLLNYTQ